MTENKGQEWHTPLPWKISNTLGDNRIVSIDGYGNVLQLIAVLPHEKDWPKAKANAAFIVESANSYESLKAALSQAQKELAKANQERDEARTEIENQCFAHAETIDELEKKLSLAREALASWQRWAMTRESLSAKASIDLMVEAEAKTEEALEKLDSKD